MSIDPWWLGLTAAQARVPCGEHTHRIRWESGVLQALDHGDPDAERALAALGGQRCPCVEVLDAWARCREDPRALVLGGRVAGDRLTREDGDPALGRPTAAPFRLPPRSRRGTQAVMRSVAVAGAAAPAPRTRGSNQAQAEDDLLLLLGLGGGIPERLVATVAAALTERLARGDRRLRRVRPQLHAALYGRAYAAIRNWLGEATPRLEVEMISPRDRPSIIEDNGMLRARLPFRWILDVGARELSTLFGRFCLSVSSENGIDWKLVTIGPDLSAPETVTLGLPRPARP